MRQVAEFMKTSLLKSVGGKMENDLHIEKLTPSQFYSNNNL